MSDNLLSIALIVLGAIIYLRPKWMETWIRYGNESRGVKTHITADTRRLWKALSLLAMITGVVIFLLRYL